MLNNRKKGTAYEELAAKWLETQGMKIICRNFRCRSGEIDLIGTQEHYLVFIEVKYRADTKCGEPEEAVGISKQKTICRVADFYRLTNGYTEQTSIRYDVVAICGEKITWYPNAFMHHYQGTGRKW